MRTRLLAIIGVLFVAVLGFGGWRYFASTSAPPATATASPVEASAVATDVSSPQATTADVSALATSSSAALPAATDSGVATSPASTSPSDAPSASDATSPSTDASSGIAASPNPSPTATIPAEPTGLPEAWTHDYERTVDGPEAALVVRTGDINNLGYGWPANFTPFSGESTPAHPYPCEPRPGAAPGTDYIMVGTGVTANDLATRNKDGYSSCSSRPENLPKAIPLAVGALPPKTTMVLVQMFVDDFQAPVFHSHFQLTLNGTRIPPFEDTLNALDQTGPIGKLVTLRLLPEYLPLLKSGNVDLYIDDPTTGNPDGYAVDFVRVLVNPKKFRYAVTVACTVVDADTQKPIAGATVSAAQVSATTGSAGTATLRDVPAGLVSAGANAVGYDGAVQLVDLPAGQHGTANFALHKHRETVADLRRKIGESGTIAIYGIHFDTASAKLRPDSLASLQIVLQLLQSDRTAHWIISGHTDNQGGADYNLNLSDARAHSVVAWLEGHGIGAGRLTPKGYGLTRPVADNSSESGRALNRRVEISLVK